MALFGSQVEREVKKESAMTEPAWIGTGQEEGIKIWRIVNFKITDWPKKEYGNFFNGDSYIILHTYKPRPDATQLELDVFFWIGKDSTADEYGTAAYKTVELDTYHDDKAIQHRETEGHESDKFKRLFPKGITISQGGAESGFRRVTARTYNKRLLHISGTNAKNVTILEVPLCKASLNSGDVFVLDIGTALYQWNGRSSSGIERVKAAQFLNELNSERGCKGIKEVLEEDTTSATHPFYSELPETAPSNTNEIKSKEPTQPIKTLLRVSDQSGCLTMTTIKDDEPVTLADFKTEDVFILDRGDQCFVWIGNEASASERKNGIVYATKYLNETDHKHAPIIVVREDQASSEFIAAVDH